MVAAARLAAWNAGGNRVQRNSTRPLMTIEASNGVKLASRGPRRRVKEKSSRIQSLFQLFSGIWFEVGKVGSWFRQSELKDGTAQ